MPEIPEEKVHVTKSVTQVMGTVTKVGELHKGMRPIEISIGSREGMISMLVSEQIADSFPVDKLLIGSITLIDPEHARMGDGSAVTSVMDVDLITIPRTPDDTINLNEDGFWPCLPLDSVIREGLPVPKKEVE